MAHSRRPYFRATLMGGAMIALSACEGPFDFDLRKHGGGLNTADAAQSVTLNRPTPDARGVLSYPNYQVAVARQGDKIGDVATRVGLPAGELARYNGIPLDTVLRKNEVIALPRRVDGTLITGSGVTTAPISGEPVDISTLAGNALDRAGTSTTTTTTKKLPALNTSGKEPIRHQVERGETAYSIARLYNISVRSLADWNGLGTDLDVREGQYLLIPVAADTKPVAVKATKPGSGSTTPIPPSAASALPAETVTAALPSKPKSPDLGTKRTAASKTSKLLMPVSGKIIRGFVKKKNDGIDIAAAAGTTVKAAADGTVAAITRDTDQVPILVLRHANNLLTVYAGVDNVTVKKGDKVKRGQTLAKIRNSDPSFLHFEVRQGFDSVDPVPFLN